MSLIKIKAALKKAKEDEIGFSWVDEEFSDLLIAIAEHILAKEDIEKELSQILPPSYISLKAFEEKYKFIAANSLQRKCRLDADFSNECCFFDGYKYYVDPEATLNYLEKSPIMKKRLQRMGRNW
jgi:hypothetical protein